MATDGDRLTVVEVWVPDPADEKRLVSASCHVGRPDVPATVAPIIDD